MTLPGTTGFLHWLGRWHPSSQSGFLKELSAEVSRPTIMTHRYSPIMNYLTPPTADLKLHSLSSPVSLSVMLYLPSCSPTWYTIHPSWPLAHLPHQVLLSPFWFGVSILGISWYVPPSQLSLRTSSPGWETPVPRLGHLVLKGRNGEKEFLTPQRLISSWSTTGNPIKHTQSALFHWGKRKPHFSTS